MIKITNQQKCMFIKFKKIRLKFFPLFFFQKILPSPLVLLVPIFLIGYQNVAAETYLVENYQMLIKALKDTSQNHSHDIIKIAEGVKIPNTESYIEVGFSLTIETGYLNHFLSRNTTIAKQDQGSVKDDEYYHIKSMQSTTGPNPPEGVEAEPSVVQEFTGEQGGTEKTIGVPGYRWRHGCGPTAVGMVLGYWDVTGFSDLFDGSASTQTSNVNQGIASERSEIDPGHYRDYSLPDDSGYASPLDDKSEEPEGDEHDSDSVADFMKTSFSSRNNFYGWSWSSDISPAFLDYVNLKNSSYIAESNSYYMGSSLTWNVLTTEIDNNRPMVFLVDTNADGYTDHFVTVVGYRDDPTFQYGCLDTWHPASTVRWCNFSKIASGQSWGIWGGWSFSLTPPESNVHLAPILQLLLMEE